MSGIVLLRKGANSDSTLEAIHDKVDELNDHILPPGVKVVPFLDRSDLVHLTTHTVLHNLIEGIILVSVILFAFLGNVRGALIVTLTIPFALLFASICLDLRHIPANLLSLGALDFGMMVEGAVVMIENIVRTLAHPRPRRQPDGRAADQRRGARGAAAGLLLHRDHHHRLPADLHAAAVEGRLFKPMAWTVAFALLGALLFSMIVGPVLASLVFPRGTTEWHNPVMEALTRAYGRALELAINRRWLTVGAAVCALAGALLLSRAIGSEFLPHLDEGAIWVRGTLAPSTGPSEGVRLANQARVILASFPEVTVATSQVGRPDDGTDTTGFFNTEYFVDLKPKDQWRPVFHQDKEELIAAMDRELEKIPGAIWNFSQPIADNMEEAVSGVKGELAIKVYGDDLKTLEEKGDQIVSVMGTVAGIQDLGLFRVIGQPNLNFVVDRDAAARYQINVADVQDAIQTAVGGNARRAGARGRAALRPRAALPAAVPRHQGSDRTDAFALAVGRARFAGAALHGSADRRRVGDLSRGQSALRRHQVRRARPRSRQHRRGSHAQGRPAGEAAARLPHRLGRRIREPEARAAASRAHHPADAAGHLHDPLHACSAR